MHVLAYGRIPPDDRKGIHQYSQDVHKRHALSDEAKEDELYPLPVGLDAPNLKTWGTSYSNAYEPIMQE